MGSVPPVVSLWSSSLPSSRIVRSAVKLVSNTRSKPRALRPATNCPVTMEPGARPNSSPRATRIAGAVCTTTCFLASPSASQTLRVESTSLRAPVGHTSMHWPHRVHAASPSGSCPAGLTTELNPRPDTLMAETPCTCSHTATHRRQRMHLSGSRTIDGVESSTAWCAFAPAKRISRIPRDSARACSSHDPLRTQVRQSNGWLDMISSNTARRASRTCLVLL